MIPKLKYDEALGLVEWFMQETGIRNYCMFECKGKCCDTCSGCDGRQERKLPCSMFVCPELLDIMYDSDAAKIEFYQNITEIVTARVGQQLEYDMRVAGLSPGMTDEPVNANPFYGEYTEGVKRITFGIIASASILGTFNKVEMDKIARKQADREKRGLPYIGVVE